MSRKTAVDYEVGYGKPPKATQFKKGVSGNPKGRSKRPLDFDEALLREAKTLITLNENGRKIRVSKHDVVVKQLINNAMKGIPSGQRMYRDVLQQALERVALREKAQTPLSGAELDQIWPDATDEELEELVLEGAKIINEERRKRAASNAEDGTRSETCTFE